MANIWEFAKIIEIFKDKLPKDGTHIDKEIKDDDGYYGEYSFFSYLLRYCIKLFEEGNDKSIISISDFIEKMLIYGDEDVKDLAVTGFLEDFHIAKDILGEENFKKFVSIFSGKESKYYLKLIGRLV